MRSFWNVARGVLPVLVGLAAWGPAPARAQRAELDARAGDRAPVAAATEQARAALDKRLGGEGTVAADGVTGGLRLVARTDGFLTGPSGDDPAAIAVGYVRAHLDAFALRPEDLATLRPVARTVSGDGVTHLRWRQAVDGVPAYDSGLTANVAADGRLLNIGGAPVADLAPPATEPPFGPSAAHAAAQRDLGVTPDGAAADTAPGPTRPTTFADGDRAELTVLADADGDRLAWRLTVAGRKPYIYDVLVDAATGAVLARHSLTAFAANANVYEYHPGAPGAAGVGTTHSVDLGPWLSSSTSLTGPNAHAYADVNAPDGIGGDGEQAPSAGTDFAWTLGAVAAATGNGCPTAFAMPCTWDGTDRATAAGNRAFVTTQVFYFVNRFHDWLTQPAVGFDAASHNFEGTDAVLAEADDSGGLSNANMSTPSDGVAPRMQMYLFGGSPAVDGGLDASVVYHEYTHGLSNRLVGNDGLADGLYARQSRAMGEGWSDWYAMDFLVDQGAAPDTAAPGEVVVGEYVTDNPHVGIRSNALDCPVGPASAGCPGTASAGPGGLTFADLGRVTFDGDAAHPYFEVHADGEIWAETLWDLRTELGAVTARRLITSAMRLAPKQPSFLDMRDAILQADVVGGGTHRAQIWAVFAARGMGDGAVTSSAEATRGVASFVTPPVLAAGAADVQSPAPLGDGDGALEPGEAARIWLPLRNPGATPLTGVTATLTTSTGGVVVGQDRASYGTIAPGATAGPVQPFAISVPAGVPCGMRLALQVAVTSDQGTLTVPVTVPLQSGRSTFTRSESPALAVPDGAGAPGITSTLVVPSGGRIDRLRVSLAMTHTWTGGLHAWLRSPAGTVVDLLENPGRSDWGGTAGNLDPNAPLVLDDTAATGIQEVGSANVTLTGPYRPNQRLAGFAGEDRAGAWTLHVVDTLSPDAGSLASWSIEADEPTCAATGPALPLATTDVATDRVGSAATLRGHVDPTAAATDATFEYGTTTAYGTRAPATALGPGGGSKAYSAAVSDLVAGATYHVRALALRAGTVVAVGADHAFVAGSDAAAGSTPAAPAPSVPAVTTRTPRATIAGLPVRIRVDRHGRFVLAFRATPAGAPGAVATRTSRTRTALGSARFTVPRHGSVRVRVTLKASARRTLRRAGTIRATVTILLAGRTFTRRVALRATR